MYVHSVILENMKGFEHLKFDLARPDGSYAGWTVFTGDNGSGKSTLLKAIAIGLVGGDVAHSLQPDFRGWIHSSAKVPKAAIELEISLTLDDEHPYKSNPPENRFPARLEFEERQKGMSIRSIRSTAPAGKPTKYQAPERTIWSNSMKGWFSCGYGPFRRVFGPSIEAAQIMYGSSTAKYATLFQEGASLSQADKWIRELQYKAIEDRFRHTPDAVQEQQILDTLLKFLRDSFMPGLTLDRVDSDGVWLKDADGILFAWGDMSDGYRSALALLIDIFRNLVETFGPEGLTEPDDQGKLRVVRSGVVLVDEIDAHLHPAWQRTIGFWLKEHFPNIQFLVTTHSPIICQAADPHGLFVLPEPGSGAVPHRLTDDEYNRVIASRPDTILTSDAFGLQNTRSHRAVKARAQLARLASKQTAGGKLTPTEKAQRKELSLFQTDEEL